MTCNVTYSTHMAALTLVPTKQCPLLLKLSKGFPRINIYIKTNLIKGLKCVRVGAGY